MAYVVTIHKDDTKESIRKKMETLTTTPLIKNGFPAHKFTGKIKSFGDGVAYQRAIRNEWD